MNLDLAFIAHLCIHAGELDVYRFAMFWRGGTGAKAFEGCISDVQKVSKATGEVLEVSIRTSLMPSSSCSMHGAGLCDSCRLRKGEAL